MTSRSGFTPSNLFRDLTAGVVVFLVAIPLCLGIALASNAPLFSGLLAGVIGGIVVGLLSGSHTSVSGPAAGLAAVVVAQIAALGSFQTFLLAVFFAGLIQIALGLARAGFVLATGSSRDDALANADHAADLIRFETEDAAVLQQT